jgi:hypothetical protein
MKRESDLKTSAVILLFTKVVKASIKEGKTSRGKVSAFRASKNLLTIPVTISHIQIQVEAALLTHSKQSPRVELVKLAVYAENDELIIIELLSDRRGLAPHVKIHKKNSIR